MAAADACRPGPPRARRAPRRASLRPSRGRCAARGAPGSVDAHARPRACASTIARTSRSDSAISSKRTATRAATSPAAMRRLAHARARRTARTESRSAGRTPGRSRGRRARSGRAARASSGVTRPQCDEAVLQARVLVVDVAQRAHLALERRRTASRDRRRASRRRGRARRRPARRSPSASRWPKARAFARSTVLLAGARTAPGRTRAPPSLPR